MTSSGCSQRSRGLSRALPGSPSSSARSLPQRTSAASASGQMPPWSACQLPAASRVPKTSQAMCHTSFNLMESFTPSVHQEDLSTSTTTPPTPTPRHQTELATSSQLCSSLHPSVQNIELQMIQLQSHRSATQGVLVPIALVGIHMLEPGASCWQSVANTEVQQLSKTHV